MRKADYRVYCTSIPDLLALVRLLRKVAVDVYGFLHMVKSGIQYTLVRSQERPLHLWNLRRTPNDRLTLWEIIIKRATRTLGTVLVDEWSIFGDCDIH